MEASAYDSNRQLREGASGADVKELQIRVAGWAADSAQKTHVAVDGQFGPGTKAAVVRFQKAYGLTVSGVVDGPTQSALNALEDSDGSTAHAARCTTAASAVRRTASTPTASPPTS